MNQHLINLYKKLSVDSEFDKQFDNLKTIEDFYNYCIKIESGYTMEELKSFFEKMIAAHKMLNNMPGKELKQVAGGKKSSTRQKVESWAHGLQIANISLLEADLLSKITRAAYFKDPSGLTVENTVGLLDNMMQQMGYE